MCHNVSQRIVMYQIYIMHIEEEIFDKDEAAKFMRVSLSTINRWMANGDLPYHKPHGRKVLFKKSDLLRYLDQFKVDSKAVEE